MLLLMRPVKIQPALCLGDQAANCARCAKLLLTIEDRLPHRPATVPATSKAAIMHGGDRRLEGDVVTRLTPPPPRMYPPPHPRLDPPPRHHRNTQTHTTRVMHQASSYSGASAAGLGADAWPRWHATAASSPAVAFVGPGPEVRLWWMKIK